MKTPAEEQIELLKRMKEGRAKAPESALAKVPAPAPAAPAPRPAAPKRPAAAKPHALNVDAKTWGRLEERRKAEFKDTRRLAAWAARLVLALPVGVAALPEEAQEELFREMRRWAEGKGLR